MTACHLVEEESAKAETLGYFRVNHFKVKFVPFFDCLSWGLNSLVLNFYLLSKSMVLALRHSLEAKVKRFD